jgi:hypothetical protein
MRTLSSTDALTGSAAGAGTAAPSPASPPAPSGDLDTRNDYAQGLARAPAPPVTTTPAPLAAAGDNPQLPGCVGPAAVDGVRLAATLDGVPVVLVFRPPTATAQVVEAWSCDGSSLLVSAAVPH